MNSTMIGEYVEIRVKGQPVKVPSACILGRTVVTTGRWIKTVLVMDEEMIEGETVADPESFRYLLKHSGLRADLFTFAQKLPDVAPRHQYHLEWDNAAVIPITTFADWLANRADSSVRKNLRRAKRLGVITKLAEFDDALVEGICRINNESPIRQGKPFWHYRKEFDAVKLENATYLDRSAFIGAYLDGELIGFIKMVFVGTTATTVQVISQKRHSEKKPTNALLAKAVEICEQKGMSHLVYGQYAYHGVSNSLTDFKRRNGFEQVLLPRYYVPLTAKGAIALKLKLHHGLAGSIPSPVLVQLLKLRRLLHSRKTQSTQEVD
jgi:hypothetical protein